MDWSNLQKDYERLGSFTAVAKEYGVSKSLVSQKLKEQGWKRSIDWSTLPELYESGMTYEQLAQHYGCSSSQIHLMVKRLGVTPRKGGSTGYRWSDEQRARFQAAVERGVMKTPGRSEHFRRLGSKRTDVNTPSEELLQQSLMTARLSFETQPRILAYWPDVLLLAQPIIVEVDGWGHTMPKRQLFDEKRDAVLAQAGYWVYRFSNEELEADADECVQRIIDECCLEPEESPVFKIRHRKGFAGDKDCTIISG